MKVCKKGWSQIIPVFLLSFVLINIRFALGVPANSGSDNKVLNEMKRAYLNNEPCQIISDHIEQAVCEAAIEKSCQGLRSFDDIAYAKCKVYVERESCDIHFLSNSYEWKICKAQFDGYCDIYDDESRKQCQNDYVKLSFMLLLKTQHIEILYWPEMRRSIWRTNF